ncbi:MAG: TrmH family RNA methyltransferase [Pseudomonadota bacterium]
MDYTQPHIILATPQMGENIGTSARAMLNCGLRHLLLTTPRDGWPNEKAVSAAAGALDVMPSPVVFPDICTAVGQYHYIYATTGKPHPVTKPVFTPAGAVADMHGRIAQGQRVAVLFGPERAGLDNVDLQLAHAFITFPANPDFASYNLAQSVLVMAYEWCRTQPDMNPPAKATPTGKSQIAIHSEMEGLFGRLLSALEIKHFFRTAHHRPTIERNLRAALLRAEMTSQEIATFQGIITAFLDGKKEPGNHEG